MERATCKTHSIRDFQCNFIYHTLLKVLEKSSDGMTTSGFEKLDKGNPIYSYQIIEIYYWIQRYSMWLYSNTVVMTASAIGDNLVKKIF
jgi:hypothetical protein